MRKTFFLFAVLFGAPALAVQPSAWCALYHTPVIHSMYEREGAPPKEVRRVEEKWLIVERNQDRVVRKTTLENAYEFDGNGNLMSYRAGKDEPTRIRYDAQDRAIDDGVKIISYRPQGYRFEEDTTLSRIDQVSVTPDKDMGWQVRTLTREDPILPEGVGRDIVENYDFACRLLQSSDSDSGNLRQIAYQEMPSGGWVSKETNILGGVTTMTTREHDERGRVIFVQQDTIGSKIFSFKSQTGYMEDARGNITKITITETVSNGGDKESTATTIRVGERTLTYW